MKILWIPHTAWNIPQRAHLFCKALSEKHEVHVTDWVADFRTPRDYLSFRYLENFIYRRSKIGNITVHGVPRCSPAIFSATLRSLNSRLFTKTVDRIITRYDIDVVVGTFVIPPPRAPRLCFDLFDDNIAYWKSYGCNPAYAEEIHSSEQAYLECADATLAASSVLVDQAKNRGARGPVYWLPNGVDIGHFGSPNLVKHTPTVVGLVGNHDRPEELDKVLEAARALPGFIFRIAGRGCAVPAFRTRTRKLGLSNILFDGPISIDAVPNWMRSIDIGLCPYIYTPGADAGSPMRLLQYSAAGIPVVCTNLEEVQRMNFSNVVLVDDDPIALKDGILVAARMPKSRPPQLTGYDLPRLVSRLESILCGDPI